MTTKAPKFERYTTPKGVAKFPYIQQPDTKFDADGVFTTKLVLNGSDPKAVEFIERITKATDEHVAKVKAEDPKKSKWGTSYPFTQEQNDEGQDTGNWIVKASQAAKVTTKDEKVLTFSVAVFDANAKPVDPVPAIYGGSEIKMSGDMVPFAMGSTKQIGISLRLRAVQILKLVTGRNADASDFGFEGDPDGDYSGAAPEAAGGTEPEAPGDEPKPNPDF